MTKTKAQLRAEAVERINEYMESREIGMIGLVRTMCGVKDDEHMMIGELANALIDLLTDDERESIKIAKKDKFDTRDDTKSIQIAKKDKFDSREKLEADVRKYANPEGYKNTLGASWEKKMLGYLDRQAAITERECADGYVNTWTEGSVAWILRQYEDEKLMRDVDCEAKIALETEELQDKVDELTEQLESAHTKNRSLKAHIAKMQEGRHGWHVKYPELEKKNAELKEKVDALEAELDAKQGALNIAVKNESNLEQRIIELEKDNDMLMQKVADAKVGAIGCPAYNPETHYCKWHNADFELNSSTLLKLRQDNYALRNERDELREKLSQAIGNAHDTVKLVDLDGEIV